jgi:hypothetical protein
MKMSDVVNVRTPLREKNPLPAFLAEGAAIVHALRQRGQLEALAQRLPLPRPGGYPGLDIFLYLLWALTGGGRGVSWLYERCSDVFPQLGAIAGRTTLCSASSVFRSLSQVHDTVLDEFGPWLLTQACDIEPLLQQRITQLRDVQGQFRHLFAFDPVRFALRWRDLPHDDTLPPAQRKSLSLAAPGHAGRHRGEAVVSLGLLEHLGSGLVLDATVSPGNGCVRALFHRAVDEVCATLTRLGASLWSGLLLCDGEFGSVPYLSYALQRGLPLITRCSRYELLHTDAVVAHMARAPWHPVEDALSGPRREACELGLFLLPPGERTRQDDGQPYAPVQVRLVVSRYRSTAQDKGHGHLIADYRYELFAALQVCPTALPAAAVVSLFYGRCGQECRFSQRNSDLDFQYPYTHHVAGLRLVLLVLFFVWNTRIVAGCQLSPPLPAPQDPAPPPQQLAPPSPPPAKAPEGPVPRQPGAPGDPPVAARPDAQAGPPPAAADAPDAPELDLGMVLAALPWVFLLRRRAGWRWDSAQGQLLDAEAQGYALVGVEGRGQRADLRFRRELGEGLKPKQLSIALSPAQAEAVRRAWAQQAAHQKSQPLPPSAKPRPHISPERWVQQLAPPQPTPRLALHWPLFTATAARDVFLQAVRDLEVWIVPGSRPHGDQGHPLVAASRAHRQHRRKTYEERLAVYRGLPPKEFRITVSSRAMGRWLVGAPKRQRPRTPPT